MAGSAAARSGAPAAGASIGEVLVELRQEFPDVTLSKIRFLEEQGLVCPERTSSGYRKFQRPDIERLRYVLGVQRDHYLPLRVIRDQLQACDRGENKGLPGRLVAAPVPDQNEQGEQGEQRGVHREHRELSRDELAAESGASLELIDAALVYGLMAPTPMGGFDASAVSVMAMAAQLTRFGVEPRHLRAFRATADREQGLVEQVVAPLKRMRADESAGRAHDVASEVAELCLGLHAALLRAAVERSGR